MNILVTGSSGFIGFHLIKNLLKIGHRVVGIDNHNNYYKIELKQQRRSELKHKNFTFFEQDINAISINNQEFDLAINLAAQAGVRVTKSKEYLYENSNVKGFESFCNFCVKNKIKKIIYASSSSVYSDEGNNSFKEDYTDLSPKSVYGKSKLKNEQFASIISKREDLSIIGLRFFSVYGPYGRPDMAYYLFANSLLKSDPIILNNRGKMHRDMTYIDDIVDGILLSIEYMFNTELTQYHEIFNLGNNKPIQTIDLLNIISKILDIQPKIFHASTKFESKFTLADMTKSRELLGYNPKTNFDKGIKQFIDWYKEYEII